MRNINEISQRDCIHSNVYAIVFVYVAYRYLQCRRRVMEEPEVQSNPASVRKQNVSGTMETGSEETTSVSSEDSTSQDNSLSQSSEISSSGSFCRQ